MPWDVPGFELVELIGSGSLGQVWRAVDRGSSQLVTLRQIGAGEALAEVQRRAAALRAVPSEHLVRVRATTADAIVLDHAAGGSLAALVARRGQLSPGEVVTAVAPIALALAEAHARDLVHGRISAREVLLTRDGKPLLDGLAHSFLYDAGSASADDVQALGRLAQQLLGPEGIGPPELLEAIAAAGRPGATAAALGQGLLASCEAVPLEGVRAPDPPVLLTLAGAPVPADPPRQRRPRLALLGVALVVVIAAAALSVRGSSLASAPAPDPPVAATPSAEPDWATLLDQLDQARAAAFAAGDPLALAEVYVPGSAPLALDREAMARLAAAHQTAVGLRHVVLALTTVRVNPLLVELHVTQALASYDLRGPAATVVHRPAGPTLTRVVVVRRTAVGWRVEVVRG